MTDPCRWHSQAEERGNGGTALRNSFNANTPPKRSTPAPGSEGSGLSDRFAEQCPAFRRQGTHTAMSQIHLNEQGTVLINLRLHPLGPKPKVPGAHLSQVLPTTFGRHWHWPPLGSQTELSEPWGSHSQAAGREKGQNPVTRSRQSQERKEHSKSHGL